MIQTGHSKILRLFYENKRANLHLRDIARKTKLYPNSTTRFLNQLEKEGILTSQKDGNLKKYRIKKYIKRNKINGNYDYRQNNSFLGIRDYFYIKFAPCP